MKISHIAALCCALSCGSAGAQTNQTEEILGFGLVFPPPATVEGLMPPAPFRPDAFREFFQTLTELAATPDPARLKSLYWPGPDEAVVAESVEQMQRVLADSPSFGLKDFARLSESRRAFWQRRVGRLSTRDASGVLLVFRNGHVENMFPLQISVDGVRIVPVDRRHRN